MIRYVVEVPWLPLRLMYVLMDVLWEQIYFGAHGLAGHDRRISGAPPASRCSKGVPPTVSPVEGPPTVPPLPVPFTVPLRLRKALVDMNGESPGESHLGIVCLEEEPTSARACCQV